MESGVRIRIAQEQVEVYKASLGTALDIPNTEGFKDVEIPADAWEWVRNVNDAHYKVQEYLVNRICAQHGHLIVQTYLRNCERCGMHA